MLKALKAHLGRFIDAFSKHDVTTLAAALAFYTALSLAPMLLLMITILGLMSPHANSDLMGQINDLVGPQAAQATAMIIQSAVSHPVSTRFAGILGIVILLFSASAVFSQLQSSLNIIWDIQPKETGSGVWLYLRGKLFSMGIVVAFIFLAVISLLVSTGLTAMLPEGTGRWSVLNNFISLAVFAYLFALMFKYLPSAPVRWRDVLFGGLITSVLFTLGKSVIGIYLGSSAIGSAYGAAGSLIVLLTWVYYSSIIVFVGAELTRAFFRLFPQDQRS